MEETWKDIPNYVSLYEVSNFGSYRVKIQRKGGKVKAGISLKCKSMKDGYSMFRVSKNGKQQLLNAHRIVAAVFLTNPENKKEVNHIDSNRRNNNVNNLEWVDPKENVQHAIKNGNFVNSLKNLKSSRNNGVPIVNLPTGTCNTKEGKRLWSRLRYRIKKNLPPEKFRV